MFDALDDIPMVTSDLPPTGGRLGPDCEDFRVEEVPAYEPCGSGEHFYLWIEKRGTSTDALARYIGRVLGLQSWEIGTAGLKDTRAITRQYISIPARLASRAREIENDAIRVLDADYHSNKLRTGHLKGNRFRLRLKKVPAGGRERAEAILAAIGKRGMPNFFGPQRFGREGSTLEAGWEVIRKGKSEIIARAPRGRRGFLRKLSISAAQAALFNRCLSARMQDGLLHRVLEGDVMVVRSSGGPFVAADVAAEQLRFDARQTVPAGPIFGPKMKPTQAEAASREAAILKEADVTIEHFEALRKLAYGTRRPNLVWPQQLEATAVGSDLEIAFELPSGSYATVLVRELTKEWPTRQP